MPQNTITDLSNTLFETMARLNDLDLNNEEERAQLNDEVKRATMVVEVAKPLISVFNTELNACKLAVDNGYTENEILPKQLVCKTNG